MIIKSSHWLAGICAAGLFGLLSNASAEVRRDLASHEHGASQLDLVVEGNTLYLQFESPWVNLIGFEHEPGTEQQRQRLKDALARLARSDELFVVNTEAGCTAQPARVESTLSATEHSEGAESHDSSKAAHGDVEKHSEVLVHHEFECETPSQLQQIDVALFAVWPGVDDIDVQMAGPGGQAATELTPTDPVADLRDIR